jgi:hypothetical protein
MKKAANKKTRIPQKTYAITDYGDHWVARDERHHTSGYLAFFKERGKFFAGVPEAVTHFPRLARGYKDPKDCPVDESHRPKSEFLMLLALRGKIAGDGPHSDLVARGWREMFFEHRRDESQSKSGRKLSEANWKIALEKARSPELFEEYVGAMLVNAASEVGASEHFLRLAQWLKKIEELEEEPIPPHYRRFIKAVETAAQNAGDVPTQKEVKLIYEAGMNDNQCLAESSFRNVMRKLYFHWLPPGKRGKNTHHKKVGFSRRLSHRD